MPRKRGQRQTVYVIAGPNGAGKTTFCREFLPRFVKCREFLNADFIAAGLAPFAPETQNVQAGRLLLKRIEQLAAVRQNFGFETTLSGRSYVRRLRVLKTDGFSIKAFFLWLPDADIAVNRVTKRAREGGHNVPERDIRRRFTAGLNNFFGLYRPIFDEWWLYDASALPPRLIATERKGKLQVKNPTRYDEIKTKWQE